MDRNYSFFGYSILGQDPMDLDFTPNLHHTKFGCKWESPETGHVLFTSPRDAWQMWHSYVQCCVDKAKVLLQHSLTSRVCVHPVYSFCPASRPYCHACKHRAKVVLRHCKLRIAFQILKLKQNYLIFAPFVKFDWASFDPPIPHINSITFPPYYL